MTPIGGPPPITVLGNLIALVIVLAIVVPLKMRWFFAIPLFVILQLFIQLLLVGGTM